MKNPVRTRCGFTLIEMLVVMAIVALLLTLAAPRYFGSLEKSKDTALAENLRVMRLAIDQFNADKGRYPAAADELVEHGYMRSLPPDPITESTTTWTWHPPRDEGVQGVADVKSGAPGADRSGRAYGDY